MTSCFRCGAEIPAGLRVLHGDECPKCGQDVHCCRFCRFYDPALNNQCSEPQADRVIDKERANFCDFFALEESGAGAGRAGGESVAARERWKRLFRD